MVQAPERPSTMPLDSSNGPPGVVDALDPSPPISRYASVMIDGFFCFIRPVPYSTLSHSLPTWHPPLPPPNSGWMPRVQPAALHFKVDPPQQAPSTSIALDFLAFFFAFTSHSFFLSFSLFFNLFSGSFHHFKNKMNCCYISSVWNVMQLYHSWSNPHFAWKNVINFKLHVKYRSDPIHSTLWAS